MTFKERASQAAAALAFWSMHAMTWLLLLSILGTILIVCGVYALAGFGYACIAAGVACIAAAGQIKKGMTRA